MKGLDKALVGRPTIQALNLVTCVQGEERLFRKHTVIIS